MPRIHFVDCSGRSHAVEVKADLSVMEGAVHNNVPGIDANCGGACACATCLVHVDPEWRAAVGEPHEAEREMLGAASHAGPSSRLSCQVRVTEALDGLVVHLPPSQR